MIWQTHSVARCWLDYSAFCNVVNWGGGKIYVVTPTWDAFPAVFPPLLKFCNTYLLCHAWEEGREQLELDVGRVSIDFAMYILNI